MSLIKARFSVLALIVVALSTLSLQNQAGRKPSEEPRQGGTLRLKPFFSNYFLPHFDPAGDSHIFIIEQIYDGLVRLDKKLNVVPSLAEYWVISENGKKYVFYLRRGVKFHHGKELDAEDVKFSLERLVNPATAGLFHQYFTPRVVGAQEYWQGKAQDVAGFKVRDKYSFEIQWKSPYVSGLYLLSMSFCKILPRDLVIGQGRNFFQRPSGTGPFKYAYWIRSPRLEIVGVRLERNNDYFGKKPYLEVIEFSPFYTFDHFRQREIDIIPYVSERLSDMDCQVLENESFATTFLGFSCHLPPFDKPSVRRALSMAIDKKELAKAAFRLDTVTRVANNFIPPKLPGFFPDEKESYNPDEARRILHQEGFLREGDFPPVVIYLPGSRSEEHTKIYRTLRDQLANLGIQLRARYYRESREEIKNASEPYLVLFGWSMDFPDPEDTVLPLFSSGSNVNLGLMRYASSRLNELAEKAAVERSWTERISLFQKIEKILNEDMPAVPLYSPQQRLALQSYVRGVKVPTMGFFHLDTRDIWLDK